MDILDGHYARKYNMVSKGGDIYDHVKDVVVVIGIFIILFIRYRVPTKLGIAFIITISIFSLLMLAQLGCQEKLYPKDDSASLNFSKRLCIGNPQTTIQYTRFFGCATWILVLIIWVFFLNKYRIK